MATLIALACAQGSVPAAVPAGGPRAGATPLAAQGKGGVSSPVAAPRQETSPPGEGDAVTAEGAPPERAPFPPPAVMPPHVRSAHEADGRWQLFSGGDGASAGLAWTVLHPHPVSRFVSVTVVAVDLATLRLVHMPGLEDVGRAEVDFAPGLVPETERARLVAVFNGGFQARHGGWGMRHAMTTLLPPKEQGCTVAFLKDGRPQIRSWPALAQAELRAFRQTPPCLVEEAELHPDLAAGRHRVWGGRVPGKVTRRRSAIGLNVAGSVLFYGVGMEASPLLLGEALRFAGAAAVAQLDVNWAWTRFLLVGTDEAGERVLTDSLVEVDFGKHEYLRRASKRDFFYLVRR